MYKKQLKNNFLYPGVSAYPQIVRGDDDTYDDDIEFDILAFFTQKEVWEDSILVGEILNRLIEPDLLTYCKDNKIPIIWRDDKDRKIDLTKQDELDEVSFGDDSGT